MIEWGLAYRGRRWHLMWAGYPLCGADDITQRVDDFPKGGLPCRRCCRDAQQISAAAVGAQVSAGEQTEEPQKPIVIDGLDWVADHPNEIWQGPETLDKEPEKH